MTCTSPSAINSPATRQTTSRVTPNAWQAIFNEVQPSANVKSRHWSEVSCTRGFSARSEDRSVGTSIISGVMNEVSMRLGGVGMGTCFGAVSEIAGLFDELESTVAW